MLISRFHAALKALPIVAILRGITPPEIEDVAKALIDEGVGLIEVPLNSPEAFISIERLVNRFKGQALLGAGTVLKADDVGRLEALGAELVISPNADGRVIRASKAAKMLSIPAFFTPTEAFSALEAGADALKLFPAELSGPTGLKAMKAVLPHGAPIFAVGGVTSENMGDYLKAGAAGFGIGTNLYKPDDPAQTVAQKARQIRQAFEVAQS